MASCFGVNQVWYTGNRVKLEVEKGERLPREERMKGYSKVQLIQYDYFFDQFKNVVPIAVEVRPNSENLSTFDIIINNFLYSDDDYRETIINNNKRIGIVYKRKDNFCL